jgi:hypothetical protein
MNLQRKIGLLSFSTTQEKPTQNDNEPRLVFFGATQEKQTQDDEESGGSSSFSTT